MRLHLMGMIAAALLIATSARAAEYRHTLVDYPGASLTGLTGINKQGHAPGNALVGDIRIPFLYDVKTKSIVNLSTVPGEQSTIVGGINNAGTTVGATLFDDENGVTSGVAHIRHADGSFTHFSHPDAQFRTDARAINDRNLITGFRDHVDGTIAFLYDPEAGTFADFAPSLATITTGINGRGTVVGRALFHVNDDPCDGVASDGSFVQYGVVRFPDGFLTYFQVNGRPTYAGDVDGTGLVYGVVYAPDMSESRIFKTDVPRRACAALRLPRTDLYGRRPDVAHIVRGVNHRGTIAGFTSDAEGDHGFVATRLD